MDGNSADLDTGPVLKTISTAIRCCLQDHHWATVFAEDGLGQTRSRVTRHVSRRLQVHSAAGVPKSVRSVLALEQSFPQKT